MKKKLTLKSGIIVFLICCAITAHSAPGDLDATFGFGGKLRHGFGGGIDYAAATATQADGKLLTAGTTHNGNNSEAVVARYNADGSPDASFGEGGRIFTNFGISYLQNPVASAIKVQPDGKIVVAGYSTVTVNAPGFLVARFNSDGSPDTFFGTGGTISTTFGSSPAQSFALGLQSDGKIVAAGRSNIGGLTNFALARYNTNGSLDTSFGTGGRVETDIAISFGSDAAYAILIFGSGKILAVGEATTDFALVQYTANGSLDPTFGANGVVTTGFGGSSRATAVAIQFGNNATIPDKIVVAGKAGSAIDFAVARYNLNGTLDTTFDSDGKWMLNLGGHDTPSGLLIQSSGVNTRKIILSGESLTTIRNLEVIRLNSDGSFDSTFDGDGRVTTYIGQFSGGGGYATFHNGKIAVAGSSDFVANNLISQNHTIVRYNLDGSLDTTFDGDGIRVDDYGSRTARATGAAVQPDGKIVVAGTLLIGTSTTSGVMRFNDDGTFDNTFDGDGRLTITPNGLETNQVLLQPDGKIILAGNMLRRLNQNGSFDNQAASLPFTAQAAALQPDGKIIIAGSFLSSGNNFDFAVARYNSNLTLDPSFSSDGLATIDVGTDWDLGQAVIVQPDGKIVVAGKVGDNLFAAARFTALGLADATFGNNGGAVTTQIGNGSVSVYGAAIQPDGKILVAGSFTSISESDSAIVRYNQNGSLDTGFDGDGILVTPLSQHFDSISEIVVQPNGKILTAGSAGVLRNGFITSAFAVARFNQNGSLDTSYGEGGKVIESFNSFGDAYALTLDSSGRAIAAGDAGNLFGVIRLIGDASTATRAPFDFDGDNKTDISIFRPSLGQWWYLRSSNGSNFAATFGASTDKIVAADFTGDQKADIAIFRPSTGQWFVLRSEDSSFFAFPFGANGDTPVPADYDGDGKADPAVFRPSNATWFIQKSSGGTDILGFGNSTDKPVPADYDGDGKADIAIFRPNGANGAEWWVRRSSNGSVFATIFGISSDKAMRGDFTGDGKADIALWRPSNGNWFILRSEDFSFFAFPFGANGDTPVAGDYDGDGKTDAGVFRPSNSTWFVQRSTAGTLIQQFGAAGDLPVPNAFVP